MVYIDGDGPNPDIYHLIWKNEGPYLEKSGINIPETIIFIHGIPTAWYFTSQEGKVLRKKTKNLSYEHLISRFTSKCLQEDIVGYFIHIDSAKLQERLFTRQKPKVDEGLNSSRSLIEYYTAQEFAAEFAHINVCRTKTGILQRFIRPSGAHNELIQAVWSPSLCVFTRRINSRKIDDQKLKPYERASTFDGPEFYSKSVPLIGKNIPCKLREQCEALVHHISNISYEKIVIQRLVAYFKVDENEKVHFLWAGSVRVKEGEMNQPRSSSCTDKPITLEPCVQNIEALKIQKKLKPQRAVSCLSKGRTCVACDTLSDHLVPITYKILIGHHQPVQRDDYSAYSSVRLSNPMQENKRIDVSRINGEVPVFIKKLYPKLKLKGYLSLCQQESFLMQKTQVCDDCFLMATRDYEKNLLATDPHQSNRKILRRPLSQERSLSSHRNIRIRQYESVGENRTPEQQPTVQLTEKGQPLSLCKVPSESQCPSSTSRSTVASSIAASLRLKMSMLLKRKESLNLSEKSDICSFSLHHQNSSPAQLKNSNISEQLHVLVDRLSQNSANISLAKDKIDPSSRDSSMVTKASLACPRIKLKSLNYLNNMSSSRIGQSRNEIKDIDDLLNESDEDTVPLDQKIHDDQSEATTNYQSSMRERYSRNGSRLIEVKDLPGQKSSDSRRTRANPIQLANEHYGSVNQSAISQSKINEASFVGSFFIKQGFPQQPPSERSSYSGRYVMQHQRSLVKTRKAEDIELQRAYASTKRERTSELGTGAGKDKENLQKSVVIEKLYKTRVNTAHRVKVKRIV